MFTPFEGVALQGRLEFPPTQICSKKRSFKATKESSGLRHLGVDPIKLFTVIKQSVTNADSISKKMFSFILTNFFLNPF
jgi:hypothetical protein